MIAINRLNMSWGSFTLFEDITFAISRKERIALAGKNGAGKSTMLRLIAGLEQASSGTIDRRKNLRIGYLPQMMEHRDEQSVYAACEQVFNHIIELENEVRKLTEEMELRTDYDSSEYSELIDLYSQRSDELNLLSSGNYHAQIERTLVGLGFDRSDLQRPCSSFSGGWRMRIELAKILLQQPDILLLDEPTNHLDIESIQWLERFLNQGKSALILISHDKAFLDATTNRTIEIELGRIHDYKANYTQYLQLREERLEQQKRAYQNQQKAIQETENFIERFRYKATKAVQVQSRIKQLAKVERIELDEIDRQAMHFNFIPAQNSGQYPLIIEALSKSYDNHCVLSNLNMTIERGEKVAFVGKNGAGKSTLIKCIMGELNDYEGSLKLGHQTEIAYFAQNQAQELNSQLSVFETIDQLAVGDMRMRINDLLGAFMFGGEASEKKVSVLSGGERSRLAIMKLLLRPANFLIFDEPTNHLDIRSKEVLKEAIMRFEGTAIIVSHDREFLDQLTNRIYEFRGGKVREYMGGIYDWLGQKELEENKLSPGEEVKLIDTQPNKDKQGAINYSQQKEITKQRRALERSIKQCEIESERIDEQLKILEERLISKQEDTLFKQYQALKEEQKNTLERWEVLMLKFENY